MKKVSIAKKEKKEQKDPLLLQKIFMKTRQHQDLSSKKGDLCRIKSLKTSRNQNFQKRSSTQEKPDALPPIETDTEVIYQMEMNHKHPSITTRHKEAARELKLKIKAQQ